MEGYKEYFIEVAHLCPFIIVSGNK